MRKRLLLILAVLTGILFSSSIVCADPPAPVAKTGQTTSYATGDDGDHEKGIASPVPRFIDNGDGTVTDNLTGLMWTKNANREIETKNWNQAIELANNLSLGIDGCGASYDDWRLPNLFELESLRDMSNYDPVLPTGHPFTNVQSFYYWSSTTYAEISDGAWRLDIG
jgi:hypothetical protein